MATIAAATLFREIQAEEDAALQLEMEDVLQRPVGQVIFRDYCLVFVLFLSSLT